MILSSDAKDLIRALLPATQTSGALQGPQERAWVTCQIPVLGFQSTMIAILTELKPLSLPFDVGGMAGLTFLRQFARWGSERTEQGWQFSLSK